jgi:hypothetical protein
MYVSIDQLVIVAVRPQLGLPMSAGDGRRAPDGVANDVVAGAGDAFDRGGVIAEDGDEPVGLALGAGGENQHLHRERGESFHAKQNGSTPCRFHRHSGA